MKRFRKFKMPLLAIALITFIFNAKGQTATNSMPIEEGSKIRQISKFGDKGFVILTARQRKMGHALGKVGNMKLACFNSTLKNLWTYEPADDEYENFLVSSEASKYIYWCTYVDDNDEGNNFYGESLTKRVSMTRFNGEGKPERLTMKITEIAKNTDILAACMDDDRFYIISHKTPDFYKQGGALNDVLYVNYMGHNETKLNRKKVAIDFSKGGQVSFLGIYDGKLYFSQQRFITLSMMKIDIYITDTEGQLLENFSIQPSVKGLFKSHHYKRSFEGAFAYNSNYFFDGNTSISTENCYGELKINFKINELYFCAYSENDKQKFNTFMFETYTIKGERIKKVEIPFLSSFEGQAEYNNRLSQANVTYMGFLDSATVKVTSVGLNIASVITVKDGEVTGKYVFQRKHPRSSEYAQGDMIYGKYMSYDEENSFNLYVNPAFGPKSFRNYMKNIIPGQEKGVKYSAITLGGKYVLFKYTDQRKDARLEFLLFE